MSILTKYATHENRWFALIFIALGLAIVVIDNTVLNVSVPYMLRDLNTNFDIIQWAISGYALTIAALLITIGRIGEMIGYKRLFLIGIGFFVLGSFIASEANSATVLIFGRAVVQAVGAAITLTTALSLLATTFEGRERAIAFGIWGSIAGASATVGPLLGGYLTTYFSWRWSLRINILVGAIALIGSILIKGGKGNSKICFDWTGTILSSLGLFLLVFAFIEGAHYGWWNVAHPFPLWPFSISIIPIVFLLAIIILAMFIVYERHLQKKLCPLVTVESFNNRGYTIGLIILTLLSLGLFGIFFMLPIYFENNLGYNALQTGLALISTTASLFVFGIISGFISSRVNIKWIIVVGMVLLALGNILLIPSITLTASAISLAPALILIGTGFGLSSAQLNNMVVSSVNKKFIGEASAVSVTVRQVGTAIGTAVIGAALASYLFSNIQSNIYADSYIPQQDKQSIVSAMKNLDIESGQISISKIPSTLVNEVKYQTKTALVAASRKTAIINLVFVIIAALLTFALPKLTVKKSVDDRARVE